MTKKDQMENAENCPIENVSNGLQKLHVVEKKSGAKKTAKCEIKGKMPKIYQIVLKANPHELPYFLAFLRKQWENQFNIVVGFHCHSSVENELDSNVKQFMNVFLKNSPEDKSSFSQCLHIRLIWMNIDNIEMIANSKLKVVGTPSILRYLSRIGPKELNYELFDDFDAIFKTNHILDLCYMLDAKREEAIEQLTTALNDARTFIFADKLTVADICVLSSIHKYTPKLSSKLKSFYNEWFNV